MYEDVCCVLFDGRCAINCQTLRQPLAAYLVLRVKTQDIQRTGHWTKHLKHLKHINNRTLPRGNQQDSNIQVTSNNSFFRTESLCWSTHLGQSQPIGSKEDAFISQNWRVFQRLDDNCRHRKTKLTKQTLGASADIILHLSSLEFKLKCDLNVYIFTKLLYNTGDCSYRLQLCIFWQRHTHLLHCGQLLNTNTMTRQL